MKLGPLELTLILIIVMVFVAIFRVILAIVQYCVRKESPKGANSIARKRYAKGEISKAEFEEIKQTLG